MEKHFTFRCAILKQEYHYRLLQEQVGGTALQVASSSMNDSEPLWSETSIHLSNKH